MPDSSPAAAAESVAAPKEAQQNKCAHCGKPETDPEEKPLKPCAKCKSVNYCTRDCLKADFKVHKKVCAKLSAEYAKTADFKMVSRTVPAKKEGHRGGLQKWQFDT